MSKPANSILKFAEAYWEQMKAIKSSTGALLKLRNAAQPPPTEPNAKVAAVITEQVDTTATTPKLTPWKPPSSWNLPPPPPPKAEVEDPIITEFDKKLRALERDPRIEEGVRIRNRQRAEAFFSENFRKEFGAEKRTTEP